MRNENKGTVFSGISEAGDNYQIRIENVTYQGYARTGTGDDLNHYKPSSSYIQTSNIKLIEFDATGAVQQDLWFPFYPNGEVDLQIEVWEGSSTVYNKDFGSKTPEDGKVYDLSANI